jgi:hypothetical protein
MLVSLLLVCKHKAVHGWKEIKMGELQANVITNCPKHIVRENIELVYFAIAKSAHVADFRKLLTCEFHSVEGLVDVETQKAHVIGWPEGHASWKEVQKEAYKDTVDEGLVLNFFGLVSKLKVSVVNTNIRIVQTLFFEHWVEWVFAQPLQSHNVDKTESQHKLQSVIQEVSSVEVVCASVLAGDVHLVVYESRPAPVIVIDSGLKLVEQVVAVGVEFDSQVLICHYAGEEQQHSWN